MTSGASPQRILVVQQNGSGATKIRGIRRRDEERFQVEVFSVDESPPPLVDDAREYLPPEIRTDLVLDYLVHPDLSEDLTAQCVRCGVPVVASGKKRRGPGIFTPPTCCGLGRSEALGLYGQWFGAPELEVEVSRGRIARVIVAREAPCGATREAAARLEGWKVEDAPVRLGLEVQFFCTANPAGWDPLYGKSPVHFAGDVHAAALRRALRRGGR